MVEYLSIFMDAYSIIPYGRITYGKTDLFSIRKHEPPLIFLIFCMKPESISVEQAQLTREVPCPLPQFIKKIGRIIVDDGYSNFLVVTVKYRFTKANHRFKRNLNLALIYIKISPNML